MFTVGRTIVSRLAGALAAPLVVWLLAVLGLQVTADDQAGLVGFLTEGLTALGMFVGFIVYAVTHRIVDKKVNPADAADRAIAVANAAAMATNATPPAATPVPAGAAVRR